MTRTTLARIGLCLAWLALGGGSFALASSPDGGAHPFVGDVGFRQDGFLISYLACHGVLVSDHVMVTSAACASAVAGFLAHGAGYHVFVSFDEAPLDFQDSSNSFISVVSAAADAPPPASKKDPTPLLGVLILDVAGAPAGVFIPSPAHLPVAGAVSNLPRKTPITTVTYRGTRKDIVSNLLKVSADQFTVDIVIDPVTTIGEPCGSRGGADNGATSFMPGTADVAAGIAVDADPGCNMQTGVARLDTARERAFLAGYGVPIP